MLIRASLLRQAQDVFAHLVQGLPGGLMYFADVAGVAAKHTRFLAAEVRI